MSDPAARHAVTDHRKNADAFAGLYQLSEARRIATAGRLLELLAPHEDDAPAIREAVEILRSEVES